MNKKIFAKAIAYLSRRSYFSAELLTKLINNGFEKIEIQLVIEELFNRSYIDDDKTASAYISELQNKHYGKNYIFKKMYEKSLASSKIKQYIELFFDDTKNQENILYLKNKKNSSDEAKTYRFLKSRGF